MTKKNRLFEVKLLLKAKWPALHGEMADRGHSNFSECDEECLNCLRISIMTYGTSKFCAIIQNFMLTKLETGTFVNMLVCLAKVLVNRIKKTRAKDYRKHLSLPRSFKAWKQCAKKGSSEWRQNKLSRQQNQASVYQQNCWFSTAIAQPLLYSAYPSFFAIWNYQVFTHYKGEFRKPFLVTFLGALGFL